MIIFKSINIATISLAALALTSCNQSSNQTLTTALQPKSPAVKSDIYSGKWNGKVNSTLTFQSKEPIKVTYCFKNRCTKFDGVGDLKKFAFSFPPRGNSPGADLVMTKNEIGYFGTYQIVGAPKVSTIQYTPK